MVILDLFPKNLKKDLDLVDEAMNFYKKSIKLNDNVMETHFNLGVLYEQSGNFEKSLYHYKKTLEINPKFTKADQSISMMTEYSSKNKHFLDMQKKLTDENLNDFEKLELYFALGKATPLILVGLRFSFLFSVIL